MILSGELRISNTKDVIAYLKSKQILPIAGNKINSRHEDVQHRYYHQGSLPRKVRFLQADRSWSYSQVHHLARQPRGPHLPHSHSPPAWIR